jgi:opacity protein-like surface antigen
MNKKFMIGGCAAIAVAGNVFAAAEEDYSYFTPFASLKAGCAFLGKRNDIKYKCGFAGAVELGVSYDAWRFGIELGFKSNKIKEPEGEYTLLGKTNLTSQNVAAAAGAAYGHIVTNDLSVFALHTAGAGGATVGLPVFGITTADFDGGAAAADNKTILGLRKVGYFEMQKLTALTGMVNVFYDYAMTDAWSLYAGLGLGVARVNYTVKTGTSDPNKAVVIARAVKVGHNFTEAEATEALAGVDCSTLVPADKIIKTEASKTVFAWQLMAGVGYEFNENWKLTLGYKLFNTAKVKQTFAGKEYKIKTPFNHTAELGLTYTF